MKRLVSTFFVLALMLSANAFAQVWVYKGIFPPKDTLKTNTGVQFVTVDPDGKIWIAPYRTNGDSLFVPDSNKSFLVRPVVVYNPDGTLWKKILGVTVGGKLIPLYNSKYGIATDNNGNILVNDYDNLVRINYKTGEGMNFINPGISALCCPAVDANGNIYLAPVLPSHPVVIYGPDFSFLGNAVDTMMNYGRWMTVSPDGNTLYIPRFDQKLMRIYHRTDEFSPYVLQDTVLSGAMIESGTWDPIDKGKLWLSVSSFFDPGLGAFAGREGSWLQFEPTNWTVKYSIKWQFFTPGDPNERPRGIAFSNDGKDAYVACFGSSDFPPVETFHNDRVNGIQVEKNNGVIDNYSLSQNYPNPFNPTTKISFAVAKTGFVTLKVYDMLGRLTSTLVNEEMPSGKFSVDFDASRLASGTYIYQLSANGVTISKKMILLK